MDEQRVSPRSAGVGGDGLAGSREVEGEEPRRGVWGRPKRKAYRFTGIGFTRITRREERGEGKGR